MTKRKSFFLVRSIVAVGCLIVTLPIMAGLAIGQDPLPSRDSIQPALRGHVRHEDLVSGQWSPGQIIEAGRRIFTAKFNRADGLGRPAATGSRFPVVRREIQSDISFSRGQGPDANSCNSCHHDPFPGGAGDFSVNVFKELGVRDQTNESMKREFSNERGTPALHGVGLLELLAREITADLHAVRDQSGLESIRTGKRIRVPLTSKGIHFGYLTSEPVKDENGTPKIRRIFDEVQGIDTDLLVRPFGGKATSVSIREFTIDAMNLHHGMQSTERYGKAFSGSDDFDRDGVKDELTEGDITAVTLFQATLPIPGQMLPALEQDQARVAHGERLFDQVGCADCHRPELVLDRPVFSEPSPYNFPGNLKGGLTPAVSLDLTTAGESPRIAADKDGKWVVHAFTDFKRHKIADADRPYFQNEIVEERFVPTDVFKTAPLWGCGSTAPYGHRGDLVTLIEVIGHHGGEANASRSQFDQLSPKDQNAVILFLESLQVLPPGSPLIMQQSATPVLPYAQ